MKKIFFPIFTAALIRASPCFAAYEVHDSQNIAANLATKAQMIQQVINSAQQIQLQLQNLQSLDLKDLDKVERQCTNLFTSMEAIKKQTDAIGEDWELTYKQWNEINPDYWIGGPLSLKDHEQLQKKQAVRWNKTLEQALTMAGIVSTGETKKTISNVLEIIKKANNATGTVQALQAASQLNGIQIEELQRLQLLMSEALKVQTLAAQQDMDKSNRASKMADDFMDGYDQKGDFKITNKGEKMPTFRSH